MQAFCIDAEGTSEGAERTFQFAIKFCKQKENTDEKKTINEFVRVGFC